MSRNALRIHQFRVSELFPELHPWPARERLRDVLARLAARNVYIGASSWKYPGWCGQLYDPARYTWRGEFSESQFNKSCLEEYAEVFKTVCVDGAYYQFPTKRYLEGLVARVPDDFMFSFKVTEDITVKKFTRLPRYGDRAGKENPRFLDPDLFRAGFLNACHPFRKNIGLLMFEFSRFHKSDFERGRDFIDALDAFLGKHHHRHADDIGAARGYLMITLLPGRMNPLSRTASQLAKRIQPAL